MIPFLFFQLTDFKTVQAPRPATDAEPFLTVDDLFILAATSLGIALMTLVLWLWNHPGLARDVDVLPKGNVDRASSEEWILIDGSNVMHWRDGVPDLASVKSMVEKLIDLGYFPGVVFDANAGWKLQNRYMHDADLARLLGLEMRQVLVVGKGEQADPFLLQTAREFGAKIVTNDRFRDWAEAHPEVLEPGFLIRGGMRDGKVWLQGFAAKEGARDGAL